MQQTHNHKEVKEIVLFQSLRTWKHSGYVTWQLAPLCRPCQSKGVYCRYKQDQKVPGNDRTSKLSSHLPLSKRSAVSYTLLVACPIQFRPGQVFKQGKLELGQLLPIWNPGGQIWQLWHFDTNVLHFFWNQWNQNGIQRGKLWKKFAGMTLMIVWQEYSKKFGINFLLRNTQTIWLNFTINCHLVITCKRTRLLIDCTDSNSSLL